MHSLDIGIIGLGGAGRAHARRFRRNGHVRRVIGYDVRPDVMLDGCERADSLADLFARVDAVSICTPDHLHLEGIVAAVGAGRHVLVEKPMVASHAQALELEEILRANSGIVFAVHHQMRHANVFEHAKRLLDDGVLGRPFYIEANYWHNMEERSVMFDDWRVSHGQSLLFGHACHPLDLIMYLAGTEPATHSTYLSRVGFEDYAAPYTSATVVMGFEDGLVAKTHVNSCAVYPQYNNLIVLGEKGSYVDGILFRDGRFSQAAGFFRPGQSDVGLNVISSRLPRSALSVLMNAYVRSLELAWRGWAALMNPLARGLMSKPDFGFRHYPMTVYNHDGACQTMIDNFVDAVQGRAAPLVGFQDAARVIRLCEEAERDGLRLMGAMQAR